MLELGLVPKPKMILHGWLWMHRHWKCALSACYFLRNAQSYQLYRRWIRALRCNIRAVNLSTHLLHSASCFAKFEVPALQLWTGGLLWVWNTPLELKSSAVFLAVLLQDWLQKTIGRVDALLMEVCRKFEAEKYSTVSSEKLLLVIVVKLVQKYMCNNNHNQQQVDLCPHLRACWTYALIEDSCPLCCR